MLSLSDKKSYRSFQLCAFATQDDVMKFFEITSKALDILYEYDFRRFQKTRKYLTTIAYLKLGVDYYDASLLAYIVNSLDGNDPVFFASAIVHEATHGYLRSKGMRYTKNTKERHEKICLMEQRRFIKRVISLQDHYSQEKKEKMLVEWNRWFDDMLASQWWELHQVQGRRWERFKEICQGKV